jgi:hypothetical protein
MKVLQNTLFSASFTLLLSACISSRSSVDWTAGTWTEGEYAAGTDDDECGIVAILNALETPLQYKIGPKTENEDTGRSATSYYYDTGGSESLSEEDIASINNNLWEGCDEPDGYASFYCDFSLHELHQTKWMPVFKEQFCPESTEISLRHGDSEGLVINANEIFFTHYLQLNCDTDDTDEPDDTDEEYRCSSEYVSRLRPSGSD